MNTPRSYRKKPVVIEAARIDMSDYDGALAIAKWCGGRPVGEDHEPHVIAIDTLEGTMYADDGDWVIRGVQGEHYPCKDAIFRATYECAADTQDQEEYVMTVPLTRSEFDRHCLKSLRGIGVYPLDTTAVGYGHVEPADFIAAVKYWATWAGQATDCAAGEVEHIFAAVAAPLRGEPDDWWNLVLHVNESEPGAFPVTVVTL